MSYFPIGFALIVAGLYVIEALAGEPATLDPKLEPFAAAPLWILVLVPLAEALVWTVAFTEGFARVFRAPLLGAICGVFAYGVLYHGGQGAFAIATSAWIGAVLGYIYVVMRARSRRAALLNVVCLRWAFIALAFVSIGGRFGA